MSRKNSTIKNISTRAGAKEWWGLAILTLPCLLYAMDFTVLQLAIPDLIEDLHPTSNQLLWIMDIYGFVLAATLITMGVLGDKIGRRKLLLIGVVLFGIASLAAAFSTTSEELIVSRALLGLAAATLAPSTLSLIRNMFHNARQRTVAVSVWMISFSVGSAIGPLVGGALLTHFWWGSVFLVAIPVVLLLLVAGPKILPEFKDSTTKRPDITSAVLSLLAMLSLAYGLKDIAVHGLGILSGVAILISALLGYRFVRRQQTLSHPFIDLTLFSSRVFNSLITVYLIVCFVTFATFYFIAQYLQLVRGMLPLEAGLWTLPWVGAFIVGSMLGPWLVQRFPIYRILAVSLLVSAVGLAALATIDADTPLAVFVAGLAVVSLGFGPVLSLITDTIIGSVPARRAGMAAGISESASELGGALGIAILGSLAATIYISNINSSNLSIPGDSLGATLASPQIEGVIAEAAKYIYITSLHWVFAVACVIVIIAALVMYRISKTAKLQ